MRHGRGDGTGDVANHRYQLDYSTAVGIEFDPGPSWHGVGTKEFVGQVRKAIEPAVEAAKTVLDKVKEIKPDVVEVTGEATRVVAQAATEDSFEITLSWSRDRAEAPAGSSD